MNNEEKILAILEKHGEMLAQMQTDISGLKETQTQMQTDISGLKASHTKMQDDIVGIKVRLDYDVDKRFDAVNEGIDAILEKLTPKDRVKELEADVVVLKTALKTLSLEVAELKKAQ